MLRIRTTSLSGMINGTVPNRRADAKTKKT